MKKCIVAIVIIFSFVLSVGVYAEEKPTVNGDSLIQINGKLYTPYTGKTKVPEIDGAIKKNGEWYVPYTPYVPTEKDLKIIEEREREMEEDNENKAFSTDGSNTNKGLQQKILPLQSLELKKSFYEIPTISKAIIDLITGSSKPLEEYASLLDCNEDKTIKLKDVASFLSDNTGKKYMCDTFANQEELFAKIVQGIDVGKPGILKINSFSFTKYPYKALDHLVVMSGYSTFDKCKVRVMDSYTMGFGNRWYEMSDLYKASKDSSESSIIW